MPAHTMGPFHFLLITPGNSPSTYLSRCLIASDQFCCWNFLELT